MTGHRKGERWSGMWQRAPDSNPGPPHPGQSLCTWDTHSTNCTKRRPKLTHFDMKCFAAQTNCSHINMCVHRHTQSLRNYCLWNNITFAWLCTANISGRLPSLSCVTKAVPINHSSNGKKKRHLLQPPYYFHLTGIRNLQFVFKVI